MRVAVIGAGPAGLCAAQRLSMMKKADVSFIVYEQTGNIGGTWVYTDKTTQDEYGLPIHSSMYKNLRTNLPKEVMEFPTFPFKHDNLSYVSRTDVLQYLTDFTAHYDLKKFIKFYHCVSKVTPLNGSWEISVKNLQTNEINVSQFDAVMVCNGHNSEPRFPVYPGMNIFRKTQMHSHFYRVPDNFKGKRVLIIGSGPSGVDITFDVSPFTERVYFSHHNPKLVNGGFSENVIHKPDVKSLTENSVLFEDGSTEVVDVIIYCTGYNYSFPFLSEDCGITVDDNFVQPLYKHLININNPTMIFTGIPWQTVILPLFDLQVRCSLNAIFKNIKLPSKEEMLQSLETEIKKKREKNLKPRYYHRLGNDVRDYMIDLANTFNITPVPEVLYKVYDSSKVRKQECLSGYRGDVYEVKDSYNFLLHKNKFTCKAK